MKCRQSKQLLQRGFDESLRIEERFALEKHLETCHDCRRIEHAQRVLLGALESMPVPPVARIDIERSLNAINRGIDDHLRQTPSVQERRWLRVAAICLVLLLGSLAWILPKRSPSPLNDSSDSLDQVEASQAPTAHTPSSIGSGMTAENLVSGDLDLDLLASRRKQVGEALLAAEGTLDRSGSAAFADHVDRLLVELHQTQWPVLRIMVGLTRESSNSLQPIKVSALALRYLGPRATRSELPDLNRALQDNKITNAAVCALVDAGEAGRAYLSSLVWDPKWESSVLSKIQSAPDSTKAERIRWVRAALAHAKHAQFAARSAAIRKVLALLPSCGREGARELLELSNQTVVATQDWLDTLKACPDAASLLVELTEERHPSIGEQNLLLALERVGPPAALGWIRERLETSKLRPLALRALAQLEGDEVAIAFLNSYHDRSEPEQELLSAFDQNLEHNSEHVTQIARRFADGEIELRSGNPLALLLSSESAFAVPALLQFVGSSRVPLGDRKLALMAATELATAQHQDCLVTTLKGMSYDDRYLAAQLLVSLRTLCGPAVVADLFAGFAPEDRAQALGLIERCMTEKRRAALLFQLARFATLSSYSTNPRDRSESP